MPSVRLVVLKSARVLRILRDGVPMREFPVALGANAAADKAVEGDQATPVGDFSVCAKNPRSKFHLSLCLDYPNAEDAARGLAAGLIDVREHDLIVAAVAAGTVPPQHTRLGGEIYIHGGGSARDWTRGCIALDDAAMREVYELAVVGTPVRIVE
jgi:murein L,D-transpeptidase YafK